MVARLATRLCALPQNLRMDSQEFHYSGAEFEALSQADNYYRWIRTMFGEHLRGRVVEVGAGRGNFSERLLELEAIDDPDERAAAFDPRVAAMYQRSKALNAAAHHEFDDVIDPVETRHRIVNLLRACPVDPDRPRRPHIDTW